MRIMDEITASAAAPALGLPTLQNVSRRRFLEGTVGAGALVVAIGTLPAQAATEYPTGAADMPNGVQWDPKIFVAIDGQGIVTIVATRSEMGTGSRTSLPMVVADELEADWAKVRLVQAPGDEPRYGNQDTDGSRSMRHFIQPMRWCGAAMRTMLEAAAAQSWGVQASEVEARAHAVVHKGTGRSLGYGELANAAAELPVPTRESLVLKDPSRFRYMGKGNVPIYDLKDITTGAAIYGSDTLLDGLLHAVVARPPVMGGRLRGFDGAAALKVPGVLKVVEIAGTPPPAKFMPLGGVAVVATNSWAALQGRDALKLDWEDGPNASYDTGAFKQAMLETSRKAGTVVRDQGNVDQAFAQAAKVVTAEYYQPHMAHAPMETPSATARVASGKCEVWACVQSPYGTRQDVAKALGLEEKDVTINVTLLGGGFGRKSKCDFVIEAALLSRAMDGAPVKVMWTREDDIHHCYYHTTSVERIEAALDAGGKVTGWRHRSVAPTIFSTFVPDPKLQHFLELGMGFVDNPFAIPSMRLENGEAASHVRIGWFRSVSNIPRAFAIQSFVGELAAATGKDQKTMLLELLGPDRQFDPVAAGVVGGKVWNNGEPLSTFPIDIGRIKRTVELVAERAQWGKTLPARSAQGIAVHHSFVSTIATVVEVAVGKDGKVSVPRCDMAIDCGFAVNPERIRSQMEGSAVMGMTLAMFSEVTFKNGRAQQGNFDDYRMLRIDESPKETHVHIVPNGPDVPPSGVGEPGLPPFAPALANAIFAATGRRVRELPFINADLREA